METGYVSKSRKSIFFRSMQQFRQSLISLVNLSARSVRSHSTHSSLFNLSSRPTPITFASLTPSRHFSCTPIANATLNQVIRGIRKPFVKKPSAPALEGCPQRKGVVMKLFFMKPKKPNSAQRPMARVRLSTGRVVICHIPGEGFEC
jgi:Ribosomal protein S12/S23